MKKRISFATQGLQVNAGDYAIRHILPNRLTDAVGPFVLLDLSIPLRHSLLESPVLHYILNTDVGRTRGCLPSTTRDMAKKILSGESGWLKIIACEYEDLVSADPLPVHHFLYHIHLNGDKHFSIDTSDELDYAAFLPADDAVINDVRFKGGEFLLFNSRQGTIDFHNSSQDAIDILLFGGRPGPMSV